jgi:hypothetical protein
MADDGEYAVFDPPRYFSSEHLKLTYKVWIEVKCRPIKGMKRLHTREIVSMG